MTRIVHLTDLHFGQERVEFVAPLMRAVRLTEPDLVVVSGDLTHRGRVDQFRKAMAFLNGLGRPFTVVPGNHDVPLFNLPKRLVAPFRNWSKGTGLPTTSDNDLGPLKVVTANTADPLQWRGGILRDEDVARIRANLSTFDDRTTCAILVCHHPLKEPPGFDRGETKGAADALPGLINTGVRIVLSGHLHSWEIGLGISQRSPRPVLMVQTGTALCAREGEVDHGFSVLDIQDHNVSVTPWLVNESQAVFGPKETHRFWRRGDLWHLRA